MRYRLQFVRKGKNIYRMKLSESVFCASSVLYTTMICRRDTHATCASYENENGPHTQNLLVSLSDTTPIEIEI